MGGGIGGLALALSLHDAGFGNVDVYESTSSVRQLGVGINLLPHATRELTELGLLAELNAVAIPTAELIYFSKHGQRIWGEPRGIAAGYRWPQFSIHRGALLGLLHRALRERLGPERLHTGHHLSRFGQDADGVWAEFVDRKSGTARAQVDADVLVGCDGIHSTVRLIINPAAPVPRYAGLIGTGGYARGVPVDTEPGSYEMIFGRRAFFGYATAPDGEVWWFANLPRRDEPARGEVEAVSGEVWRRRLQELFAGDAGPAVRLIQATPEVLPMSPIHSLGHLPSWHRGRMVVIGDAAHAPSPTSGQGASLSIEDAVVLAQCLRDLPDPAAAFARFEAARRPRVERIVKAAARINNNKAAGPVARVFRDALLPVILRLTAGSKA